MFATPADRVANRDALQLQLEERLTAQPTRHWLERLQAEGRALRADQHDRRGRGGSTGRGARPACRNRRPPLHPGTRDPVRDRRVALRRGPAAIGEHTREVLREAGYAEAEIDGLAAEAAIGLAS